MNNSNLNEYQINKLWCNLHHCPCQHPFDCYNHADGSKGICPGVSPVKTAKRLKEIKHSDVVVEAI